MRLRPIFFAPPKPTHSVGRYCIAVGLALCVFVLPTPQLFAQYRGGAQDGFAFQTFSATVLPNGTTEAAAADPDTQLKLWPNPFQAGKTIYIEVASKSRYTLCNTLGQTFAAGALAQGRQTMAFSVPAGVYFLQIVSGGKRQTLKIISQE